MISLAGLFGVSLFRFIFFGPKEMGFFSFFVVDFEALLLEARLGSLEGRNVGLTGPWGWHLMLGGGMDGGKSGGRGTTTAFLGAGLALGVECLGLENLGVLAGVFGGGALPVDVPDEVDEPEQEG